MDKLRVAAYCRVSTDKEDQVNSLTSQMKYFTEYINSHDGWQMCEVYYDEGISGTSIKKRAGFNRMISDANAHKMDLILTKEVSRFARNTVDTLSYTRHLKELNIGVVFMTDNIDTRDSDGELRLSIMASIAQEESRKTSERVKWGQKRRMEQGIVFGRDMFGYAVRNGQLIVNQDEAETVKLIFNKFLAEGKGTHVIAREL
ncbi:MAG: recombinase family protein, partial [Bacillota bacterium]